jgi:hypothetical protein
MAKQLLIKNIFIHNKYNLIIIKSNQTNVIIRNQQLYCSSRFINKILLTNIRNLFISNVVYPKFKPPQTSIKQYLILEHILIIYRTGCELTEFYDSWHLSSSWRLCFGLLYKTEIKVKINQLTGKISLKR